MNANCKREQAPAFWLRTMSERFRRRLTFHGVGVGPEDFCLLEHLCDVVNVRTPLEHLSKDKTKHICICINRLLLCRFEKTCNSKYRVFDP